ncbi:hypothetical protein [Nocardia sp. NPDC051570]|uniref:hypothetical protein n=1 Tax=Nocardia sp. NPDC051570 TaxID=3364324 RepID=UPI0037B68757
MAISRYAKAAMSITGGIVAWGTALVGLLELVPDKRAVAVIAVLLAIVHAAQSFSVWLARNEPAAETTPQPVGTNGNPAL